MVSWDLNPDTEAQWALHSATSSCSMDNYSFIDLNSQDTSSFVFLIGVIAFENRTVGPAEALAVGK